MKPSMSFLCCDLKTSQDKPYKVYISLKLRVFYVHFKKENNKNGIWTNVVSLEFGMWVNLTHHVPFIFFTWSNSQ